MSYNKHTWVNNVDAVDEDKMNNIENGIASLNNDLTNVNSNISSLTTRMNETETNINDITTVQAVEYSYNNNVAVQPPVVFYKNGLIYVYAQLITGVTGTELSLLQFSRYKAISGIGDFTSPINCHGGCDGETGIRAGSDVVFVNISTSNGNGKVFIVIPVEEK